MTAVLKLRLLVDTNVWFDNFDGTRSASRLSRDFLDLASEHGAELLYGMTSIKDIYYLVARRLKIEARQARGSLSEQDIRVAESYARGCVDSMVGVATAVACDASDLWLARKFQAVHGDLEDCLIMAAAKRAGADYVVTNDTKFLRQSAVPALDPSQMIALLRGE